MMNIAEQIQDDTLRRVLDEFWPRFAPDGQPVWVLEEKSEPIYAARHWLRQLRLPAGAVLELPNVVIRDKRRCRLWLIDVMTLGCQMSVQRREWLLPMLRRLPGCPLFVTALRNRKQFRRLLVDCPWGTIAWFASHPDHLVHFDDNPDPGLLGRLD